MTRKTFLHPALAALLFLAGAVFQPVVAFADDDDDDDEHEQALEALEKGLVRPLSEILAAVRRYVDGHLIEVEFDRDDGRYIYELEFLQPSGQIIELKVDAQTMEILEID